jgi:hypothetical protein
MASWKAKMTHKSAGCSLLRDENFSCSLDVLYGSLGKYQNFFEFSFMKTPGSGSGLDPDPH